MRQATEAGAFRRGVELGGAVVTTAMLASLPASAALTFATRSRWTSLVAGLVAPAGGILAALSFALALALLAVTVRRDHIGRLVYGAIAIAGAAAYALVGIGAVRFQQERGVAMTLADFRQGLHVSFVKSQLPILLNPLYGVGLFVALPAVVFVTWRATRLLGAGAGSWRVGASALAPITVFALAVVGARATDRGKFSVGPYCRISLTRTHPADDIQRMPIDRAKRDVGLAMLGAGRAGKRCPPASTPLDRPPRDADGARLVRALDAVSERTLDGQGGPFSIWLIVLESIAAEDVSALNPALPRGLTGFFDEAYAGAKTPGDDRFASARMYQAGVRTAQAFSAVLCGYGTLPHSLAPLRDLGGLPLRCLPDVLDTAHVQQRFYYPADAHYDRMAVALDEHRLTDIVVPNENDHPVAHWGVTDRALLGVARDDLETRPLGPTFTLVFTLSSHSPFTPPPDYPGETEARVRPELAAGGLAQETVDHLAMAAYVDAVLGERLPEIRARELARGTRPVFVVLGDHASGVGVGTGPLDAARIPFLVWLPPPRGDETAVREELRAALAATSLSQNDVPRFLLALLSRSPELLALAPAAREHSIGGQRLSPTFTVPAPLEGARIWTIDAVTRTHFLDRDDVPLASFVPHVEGRTETNEADPTTEPVTHALAWLAKRGKRCGAPR